MRSHADGSARLFDVAALCVSLSIALSGCGITQPKYVDHDDADGDGTGTATALSECEKAALAAFETSMQPAVVATCATSSCHQLTQIEGDSLSATDATKNRAQLLKFSGASADTLFDKISMNGQTHGGGDQSGSLPKATIEAWTSKEAACL